MVELAQLLWQKDFQFSIIRVFFELEVENFLHKWKEMAAIWGIAESLCRAIILNFFGQTKFFQWLKILIYFKPWQGALQTVN